VSQSAATAGNRRTRPRNFCGIRRLAVDPHLIVNIVNMRTGAAPGLADEPEFGLRRNRLSDRDKATPQMGVKRCAAKAVVDLEFRAYTETRINCCFLINQRSRSRGVVVLRELAAVVTGESAVLPQQLRQAPLFDDGAVVQHDDVVATLHRR
jgi:hypothetical protein